MEGPFIAAARKGAQKEEAILPPGPRAVPAFSRALRGHRPAGGHRPGAARRPLPSIREVKDLCAVSIAHTTANYDQAKESFDAGITHATHLFNAHERPAPPGPRGGGRRVFDDSRVYAELICDGFHIHPAALRNRLPGAGGPGPGDQRLHACQRHARGGALRPGGPDGHRPGGGKPPWPTATIAGSVSNLHQEVKNLVRFGIPLEQAVKAASLIPARSIGLEEEIGSIAPGKRADLVVLDENLDIVADVPREPVKRQRQRKGRPGSCLDGLSGLILLEVEQGVQQALLGGRRATGRLRTGWRSRRRRS